MELQAVERPRRVIYWFACARESGSPTRTCSFLDTDSLRLSTIMSAMTTKEKARRTVPRVVAALVKPVSTRLSRMEDLLLEMRAEQDVKLRKINKLQHQFEELTNALKRRITEEPARAR